MTSLRASGWRTIEPLDGDAVARASAVGRRLRGELRTIFELLPSNARTGTGLARTLNLDRGTCTRFVNICRKPLSDLEVLLQAPGLRGLEQVVDAAREQGFGKSGEVDAARAAIEQFGKLVYELGGSHTKLCERIEETSRQAMNEEAGETHSWLERRRLLYEAAAEMIGHRTGTRIAMQIFRPTPGDTNAMDQVMIRGVFGHQIRHDACPYALQSYGRNDSPNGDAENQMGDAAFTSPEGQQALGFANETVLEEFSSSPVPLVTTRGSGRYALTCVDPDRAASESGVDLAMAHALHGAWRLPQFDDPPIHEVSTTVKYPCERLVHDVFLHRSMAAHSIPSLQLHLTTPGVFANLADHWYDQLPDTPKLQLLGQGAANLPTRFYHRYPELAQHVFGRLGWSMDDFVGFRCEVEYPVWCGFYSIIFDYSSAQEQANHE